MIIGPLVLFSLSGFFLSYVATFFTDRNDDQNYKVQHVCNKPEQSFNKKFESQNWMLLTNALGKHINPVNHLHLKPRSTQHCWTGSPVYIQAVTDQGPLLQSLVWGLLLSTGSAKPSNYLNNSFTHFWSLIMETMILWRSLWKEHIIVLFVLKEHRT